MQYCTVYFFMQVHSRFLYFYKSTLETSSHFFSVPNPDTDPAPESTIKKKKKLDLWMTSPPCPPKNIQRYEQEQ
jgi:hypothetical protein